MARQIGRVFVENKLAVVGAVIIVLMVLFCFVGPVFYHTNQTNTQEALLNSVQNAAAEREHPARHGLERLRHARAHHVRREDLADRRLRGGGDRGRRGRALRGDRWLFRGLRRLGDDAHRRRAALDPADLPADRAGGDLHALGHAADSRDRVDLLARRGAPRARRDAGAARPRVRAGGSRYGRHRPAHRAASHHPERDRDDRRERNLPGGRRDILLLGALGFLGLGVPTPKTDWGSMLSDAVNYATLGYWWEIYPTAIAFVLVVIALNFVGDALRDALRGLRLQRR